jgi:hypothetical protein
MRRSAILVIAAGLTLSVPGAVFAQESTPTMSGASCETVTPRDTADFDAIAATPTDGQSGNQDVATPEATPFAMPAGDPASDEDVAQITQLYGTLVDCLNRADFLRISALYTDEYLQRNFSADAIRDMDATPQAEGAETQSEFVAVQDARVLGDDRLAALIVTQNPETGEIVTYSELVRSGDTLQIDKEEVVTIGTATPAA